MSDTELRPLEDGRWLLRRWGRRLVLPAELGRRLAAGERVRELDDLDEWDELVGAAKTDQGKFSRARGVTLLSSDRVVALTQPLVFAASWPVLVIGAALGLGGMAWGSTASLTGGVDWRWVVVLLMIGGLVHELGHATALLRGGGRPGAIGFGLMTVVPVFWCDVSEIVLLERSDRLRVDFAGPLWQLVPAGGLAVAAGMMGSPTAMIASHGMFYAVIWSLLPLLRTDGAWALADALEISGLEAPLPAGVSRGRRYLIAATRMVTAGTLAALVLALPWRVGGRLGRLFEGPPPLDAAAALALGTVAFLVIRGVGLRVVALLKAAAADLSGST